MADAPDWLVVGRIVAAFGTKGELRVMSQTDFPERFEIGAELWMERQDRPFTVEHCRWQKGQAILKLGAIDDRDQAEELHGRYLRVPGSALAELDEGEYYLFQLRGLTVITEDGRELGRVDDVLQTGANDVYIVATPHGELLLPAIEDVIKEVDLAAGRMVVHLLPGLMPDKAEDEALSC
ncbi:MAG TPA: ribosome maturation factor RimM [Chloroflexota bacterium]|nr:ribosome maturation factor RimM [Chloroflexota bacterium]